MGKRPNYDEGVRGLGRARSTQNAEAGYPDAVPHHLGHGLGIGDDTLPSIVPASADVFVEGEVVCIEPGVYLPGVGGGPSIIGERPGPTVPGRGCDNRLSGETYHATICPTEERK